MQHGLSILDGFGGHEPAKSPQPHRIPPGSGYTSDQCRSLLRGQHVVREGWLRASPWEGPSQLHLAHVRTSPETAGPGPEHAPVQVSRDSDGECASQGRVDSVLCCRVSQTKQCALPDLILRGPSGLK
jgi:hypothetical protein